MTDVPSSYAWMLTVSIWIFREQIGTRFPDPATAQAFAPLKPVPNYCYFGLGVERICHRAI